jgi:hypothetical protein
VDADGLSLADTVEAADALFKEAGVQREIEEDEVVGELEIATLAANLGANQELGAIGFCEPGGLAVALHERKAFVEEADFGAHFLLQGGFDGGDFAQGFADEEDLGGVVLFEKRDEPVEAGVVAERVTDVRIFAGFLGVEFA